MESVLKECGKIISWKRVKDGKGKPVNFGIVEFVHVLGVIRVMKVLNNMHFKGKPLEIKIFKQPKKLICKALLLVRVQRSLNGKG